MNEKIKALAEQANLQPYYDAQEVDIEKFAELIVKECAEVAIYEHDNTIYTAQTGGYVAAGRGIAAKLIKEHFGIK